MTASVEFAFEHMGAETMHALVAHLYGSQAPSLDLSGLVLGQWFRVKPKTYLPPEVVYGAEAILLERLGLLETVEVLLQASESDGFVISLSRRVILRKCLLDRLACWGAAPLAVSPKNDARTHPFAVGAIDLASTPEVLRTCRVVVSRAGLDTQSWLPLVVARSDGPQTTDLQVIAAHLASNDDALIFHTGADDSLEFGLNVLTTPNRLGGVLKRWDDKPVLIDDRGKAHD